jgi:hypothetical protein
MRDTIQTSEHGTHIHVVEDEVMTAYAEQTTMTEGESGAREKSKGRLRDTEVTHDMTRTEEEYGSDTQGRDLEKTESNIQKSVDEGSTIVQAPSPKRPKKLKVGRHGEKPPDGRRSRTRMSSLRP